MTTPPDDESDDQRELREVSDRLIQALENDEDDIIDLLRRRAELIDRVSRSIATLPRRYSNHEQ